MFIWRGWHDHSPVGSWAGFPRLTRMTRLTRLARLAHLTRLTHPRHPWAVQGSSPGEAATLQQVLPSPPSSPSALLPLPSPHSHSLPQPMTLPLPPPNPASAVTPPARRNPQAGAARAGRTRHDPHGGGGLPRWRRCRVARRQSGRAAPARQAAGLRRGAPSPSVPSFGLQVCRLASGCVRVCLPIGGLRVRLLAWCRILLLLLPLLLLRIVGRHVAPGHEGV